MGLKERERGDTVQAIRVREEMEKGEWRQGKREQGGREIREGGGRGPRGGVRGIGDRRGPRGMERKSR